MKNEIANRKVLKVLKGDAKSRIVSKIFNLQAFAVCKGDAGNRNEVILC